MVVAPTDHCPEIDEVGFAAKMGLVPLYQGPAILSNAELLPMLPTCTLRWTCARRQRESLLGHEAAVNHPMASIATYVWGDRTGGDHSCGHRRRHAAYLKRGMGDLSPIHNGAVDALVRVAQNGRSSGEGDARWAP